MFKFIRLVILASVFLVSSSAFTQQGNARGPIGASPYDVVSLWADPFANAGYAFGGNSGVLAESADRIIIAQRGETALPHPLPDGFLGFAGNVGANALRDTELRTWNNCLFIVNADGEPIEKVALFAKGLHRAKRALIHATH